MITNLSIGHYGRLGNQIFQYALLKAVSYKNNFEVLLPEENKNIKIIGRFNPVINDYDTYKLDLYECFQIKDKTQKKQILQENIKFFFNEKFMHFDNDIFDVNDNTNFHGYFQCADYFYEFEERIKNDLLFNNNISNITKRIISQIKNDKQVSNITTVHVRRGDGIQDNGKFQVLLDEKYYLKMFSKLETKDSCFLVISDDVEWCKNKFSNFKNLFFLEEYKEKVDSSNHLIDFCALSSGESIIMANSSYSWWAAWLSNTDNIYCPNKWWGWANSHFSEENLRHKKWNLEQI